jgi:O-antigen ligase
VSATAALGGRTVVRATGFAQLTAWTFWIGMPLLAFSTAPGSGGPVLAYGLPVLALTAALYLAFRLMHPYAGRGHLPALFSGAALVGALSIATLYSPFPGESLARYLPNVLGFVIFCYVLSPLYASAPGRRPTHESLADVCIVTGATIGIFFVVNFAGAVAAHGLPAVLLDRVTGGLSSLPWGASNVVASHLILPFFLTFAPNARAAGGRRAVYVWIARGAMVTAVVMTQSRGAALTLVLGLVLLLLVLRGRARRRLAAFLLSGLLAVLVADYVTGGALAEQFAAPALERFSGADIGDLNGRTTIWEQFLSAFAESPALGIGYYASTRALESTGHNFLLTTLVERGVVGFCLSALVLVTAAAAIVRTYRLSADPTLRAFTGCLAIGGGASCFHLLFEDANFTQPYIILSWVALALPELTLRHAQTGGYLARVPTGVPSEH